MIGFAIPKLNEESISKSDLLWGRSESKTIRQVIILYYDDFFSIQPLDSVPLPASISSFRFKRF